MSSTLCAPLITYIDLRTWTEWEFLICEGDLFALMPLLFIPLARPGDSTLPFLYPCYPRPQAGMCISYRSEGGRSSTVTKKFFTAEKTGRVPQSASARGRSRRVYHPSSCGLPDAAPAAAAVLITRRYAPPLAAQVVNNHACQKRKA